MVNLAQPCDSKGVQSILEINQNTYESVFICKMCVKKIPECIGHVCGGPCQRRWGMELVGNDSCPCKGICQLTSGWFWNDYSCSSSQSWGLGALWASLTANIFQFVWGIVALVHNQLSWHFGAHPSCRYLKNKILEAHKLGGSSLGKCTS